MKQETKKARDQAYQRFVESGRITERRADVLELVDELGPGTAKEIWKEAHQNGETSMEFNTFQPRCTKELPEAGLLMPVEQRKCSESGETATVWAATIPKKGERESGRDELEGRREKRDRLIREGRVRKVADGRYEDVWEVEGDTDTYVLTVDKYGAVDCTCTWSHYRDSSCSHELAVKKKRDQH